MDFRYRWTHRWRQNETEKIHIHRTIGKLYLTLNQECKCFMVSEDNIVLKTKHLEYYGKMKWSNHLICLKLIQWMLLENIIKTLISSHRAHTHAHIERETRKQSGISWFELYTKCVSFLLSHIYFFFSFFHSVCWGWEMTTYVNAKYGTIYMV